MANKQKRGSGRLLLLAGLLGLAFWGTAKMEKPLPQLPPRSAVTMADVKSWGYQLQNVKAARLSDEIDALVVDYSRDGSDGAAFTPAEIAKLRHRDGGKPRIVLAYLSIGEAESYRYYWWGLWHFIGPRWLGKENKQWKGNYPVRYWYRGWQSIIFNSQRSMFDVALETAMPWRRPYLDRVLDAGFDGVYLDRVDVFGEWEEEREKAAKDMVHFVATLSAYAKTRRPGFLIVPQNGEELLRFKNYRRVIDGIAKEDLFFGIDGDGETNDPKEVKKSVRLLEKLREDGLPVLIVEYLDKDEQRIEAQRLAGERGYVINFAKRALDETPVPVPQLPVSAKSTAAGKPNGGDGAAPPLPGGAGEAPVQSPATPATVPPLKRVRP